VVVGAERLYYNMDQLGSVRELVDANGVVRADYRYSTYGERTKVGGDLDSNWGYAGLFHHGPSGLDLATHRTYDSKMGRWISRDPLGEGVDYNLYRYCGNSPINFIDPDGLDVVMWIEVQRGAAAGGDFGENQEGHAWLEVGQPGATSNYSIGAWPRVGLKSPDPNAVTRAKGKCPPIYKEAARFKTTPVEDAKIIKYYESLRAKQTPGEWYRPAFKGSLSTGDLSLDLTKTRVCTTVAQELVRRALEGETSSLNLPSTPLAQPNNLYNYYHPGELPPGTYNVGGYAPP
jgi:RHS repeat-associated protein